MRHHADEILNLFAQLHVLHARSRALGLRLRQRPDTSLYREVYDTQRALSRWRKEEALRAADEIDRLQGEHPLPTSDTLSRAPEALRLYHEDRLCHEASQPRPGDDATSAARRAWAQALAWWHTPRWVETPVQLRLPLRGLHARALPPYLHTYQLTAQGRVVALAVARRRSFTLLAPTPQGWRRVTRCPPQPDLLAWAQLAYRMFLRGAKPLDTSPAR